MMPVIPASFRELGSGNGVTVRAEQACLFPVLRHALALEIGEVLAERGAAIVTDDACLDHDMARATRKDAVRAQCGPPAPPEGRGTTAAMTRARTAHAASTIGGGQHAAYEGLWSAWRARRTDAAGTDPEIIILRHGGPDLAP
ncbi:hypothetical protein AA0498_1859 [Acidomonas methanolica]|uniref:Uncharacterized protein n=1 Tax=Acidomonas methanolica NBRC 104435 TaxID=1231351 RepID=A0A023D879_ACIMT|nr:hypothetical protein Amme_128_002 [Acidomonas methanolica NBRC 104435]GBQ53030.1 hypothetical protein AA0498_1859 [Acidomonas methanolica]GEL00704.1 hypothetical protein AME01nite_32020 [Acidomonas methanolica NBRC 104435]